MEHRTTWNGTRKLGEKFYNSMNAAKFLEDLAFTEYQEPMPVREAVSSQSNKVVKPAPEWSGYQEPEYSEEEIADVFKD